MKQLVAMIGLPRSGKSTYIDNNLVLYKCDIICADDIRLALGTQFDPKLEPFVWAIHNTMLRAKMIRGKNIVLDETNTTITRIDKYYSLCEVYNYELRLIYMATPQNIYIERNVGEGSVPNEVIYRMNEQLQKLLEELRNHSEYSYITI